MSKHHQFKGGTRPLDRKLPKMPHITNPNHSLPPEERPLEATHTELNMKEPSICIISRLTSTNNYFRLNTDLNKYSVSVSGE